MRTVVTGVAGFIGSHLAEQIVAAGHTVLGIDCFTPYYDQSIKHENLARLLGDARFEFIEADLRTRDPRPFLADRDVAFHLAAQPGVRLSWSEGFPLYDEHNILVTQRLLEAAKDTAIGRVVFASSSSVYGNAPSYPTKEDDMPRPHSPYGVTKLAAEHLCSLYADNWGVPTVSLRYFTVYGPRQRPDMAMHRLIQSALDGEPFTLFGTGHQVRDFTYVGDVVAANLAAAEADVPPGTIVNIAGGSSTTMLEVVAKVEQLVDRGLSLVQAPAQAGDVERTGGSTDRAEALLGWTAGSDLDSGLREQVRWHQRRCGLSTPSGPSATREV